MCIQWLRIKVWFLNVLRWFGVAPNIWHKCELDLAQIEANNLYYLFGWDKKSMDVYVDIDGTLTLECDGWGDEVFSTRTPRYDVIEKVNQIAENNHKVVIWTARREIDREVTEKWLNRHGVKYDKVVFGKPMFDWYICDKSINVEDLDELDIV